MHTGVIFRDISGGHSDRWIYVCSHLWKRFIIFMADGRLILGRSTRLLIIKNERLIDY